MYEEYWGLKEKPFENTPDPRFLYYSQQHEEALKRLLYAVKERKGAAMLTGEYGSGKTVLSRALLSKLGEDECEIALIINPSFAPLEFLNEITYQLGVEDFQRTKFEVYHTLNEMLYKNMEENKDTIIIIDEAQAIEEEATFEELRLILNYQLNERFLLTLILLGQPELQEKISKLEQLDQRLGIRYHLNSLDKKDTQGYIAHRLKIASQRENIFEPGAQELVYTKSGGIPRRINNICDLSLFLGYERKAKVINEKIVQEATRSFKKKEDTLVSRLTK